MSRQPISTNADDVSAALRLLAESVEEEEKRIRGEGSKAMNEGDYDMVNEYGRMKKGSPNGTWEISDKGREWLKKQTR